MADFPIDFLYLAEYRLSYLFSLHLAASFIGSSLEFDVSLSEAGSEPSSKWALDRYVAVAPPRRRLN
jgi:hypothetical protein